MIYVFIYFIKFIIFKCLIHDLEMCYYSDEIIYKTPVNDVLLTDLYLYECIYVCHELDI